MFPVFRAALAAGLLSVSLSGFAKTPLVVTTIKPLHSLVAQVMEGVAEPLLLIREGSPHGYRFKPSDATALAKADLAVWVNDDIEPFMEKAVEKAGVRGIEWSKLPGLKLLKNRHSGLFGESDEHEADEDEYHHEHGEDEHHHEHGGHHHHHGVYNPHLWFSTENSARLVEAVADALVETDPEHRQRYESNTKNTLQRLSTLKESLSAQLRDVQRKPFITFHDAYPYFEEEFGLRSVGVVRVDLGHHPGAKQVAKIQEALAEHKVVCLFGEPQFPSKLIPKLLSGTEVRAGVLDPIGGGIPPGAGAYEALLRNLGDSLASCLK